MKTETELDLALEAIVGELDEQTIGWSLEDQGDLIDMLESAVSALRAANVAFIRRAERRER